MSTRQLQSCPNIEKELCNVGTVSNFIWKHKTTVFLALFIQVVISSAVLAHVRALVSPCNVLHTKGKGGLVVIVVMKEFKVVRADIMYQKMRTPCILR